jgi:ssDNA-binding Zn-finger/Zn-ribbon topoisomerase 1
MNKDLEGKRVRLIHMDDEWTKLKEGDEGVIKFIDDAGIIHVNWDNGEGLGLLPGIDKYEILDQNKAKCPSCGYLFDYLSVPEAGMGYVLCPKCKETVTQKNII